MDDEFTIIIWFDPDENDALGTGFLWKLFSFGDNLFAFVFAGLQLFKAVFILVFVFAPIAANSDLNIKEPFFSGEFNFILLLSLQLEYFDCLRLELNPIKVVIGQKFDNFFIRCEFNVEFWLHIGCCQNTQLDVLIFRHVVITHFLGNWT